MSYLDAVTFRQIIAYTPLISLDLVVEDERGRILLGLRLNRPAQGFWFVPGGRVRKNERLDAAFLRITETELGTPFLRSESKFLGVYEHLYGNSVFGESPDTHYVVLAYRLQVKQAALHLPSQQHSEYRWFNKIEALQDQRLHKYSRAYLEVL